MTDARHSQTKPTRLDVWGDNMLNKLPGKTQKGRKRAASKNWRVIFNDEDSAER